MTLYCVMLITNFMKSCLNSEVTTGLGGREVTCLIRYRNEFECRKSYDISEKTISIFFYLKSETKNKTNNLYYSWKKNANFMTRCTFQNKHH